MFKPDLLNYIIVVSAFCIVNLADDSRKRLLLDNKPVQSVSFPLREPGAILGKDLFPTIYQSDKKSMSLSKHRGRDREMFTVAVKIEANHETHHVKVCFTA